MSHHRRLERKELTAAIPIINSFTGEQIGELVNITVEGMMIIAEQALEVQSIFQYRLVLPEPILGHEHIDVGVDCLWCREAENFSRYWAGFQIIDAPPEAIDAIATLITNFAKD